MRDTVSGNQHVNRKKVNSRDMTPAIVLGCHKIGLGVIRALGENKVPVVGVYYNKMDMGYASKYVVSSYHCPHPDEDRVGFISFLMDLASRWGGAVLMPSDDASLISVSMNKDQLGKYFKVVASPWGVAKKFIIKKHTYSLAEEIGVHSPRTRVPESLRDAVDFVNDIGLPCLLKPAIGHRFYELFREKMVYVNDKDTLEKAYHKANEAGLEMMVQELIPGSDTGGVNYNSYFINGEPLVEITAEKVRLSPPKIGFPRVVISKLIPEVIEPGRKMLRALGYSGFSCMEFKMDARDGIYKLMEINGRQNLSTPLSVRSGMNFPYLTYIHILDGAVPEIETGFKEGIYWIDIGKDIIESVKSYKIEGLSLREFLRPYFGKRVFTILSCKDPLPFFKRIFDIAIAGIKLIVDRYPRYLRKITAIGDK